MDLKSFREDKLKIKTQSAFAELIDVEQSNVSRWEKDPSSIPFQIIQKILEKTGATYEELTGWKKPIPKPLDVKNTWEKADFTRCTLSEYISTAMNEMEITEECKKAYIEDLQRGVEANLVKPKIAIVGRSDTGKSTLINALLGTDKMPTSWTPTTSIAVYIKHISDKPSFIEDDAWIFANQKGSENAWDESQLYNEEYCRMWKIGSGGIETLRSFGTRQGDNYDKQAGSAVVFIDAPVLTNCDIVDLPGFGTETESDDNITFATAQKADVVIYLSQANGFMRIEDITYLKRNICELPIWEKKNENKLKPLSNLFVVASQAHTVNNGNRAQLKEILDVGCANLIKTLPDEYWEERKKLSGYAYADKGVEELRSRFFSYAVDIQDICIPFNTALTEILEALPALINQKAKDFVRDYVESREINLKNEIEKYEGIVAEREKFIDLYEDIKKNEVARAMDNDKRKNDFREVISQFSLESVEEFSEYLSETVNTDALVRLMKDKGIKNKKEDVEIFGSVLQSMLQERCEKILSQKTDLLSEKTKEYITSYTQNISQSFDKKNIVVDFDAKWAFASALSNIGLIGGFGGFLASTVYGTILLSSAGFSISSSVFGAILTASFGPISLALGLILAVGLGIAKLFGGGWQKSVAKKIVSAFDDNNSGDKYRDGIRGYWKQTEEAFNEAAEQLDKEWEAYVNNLRDTINEYNIDYLQRKIASLRNVVDFFENIPL